MILNNMAISYGIMVRNSCSRFSDETISKLWINEIENILNNC